MSASNVLTGIRLVLALVFFFMIGIFNRSAGAAGGSQVLLLGKIALVLLIFSLCTDYLDGYIARWMENESEIGRIADPLVDKVLICGSLVMFLGFPDEPVEPVLREWMVVVVVSRELIVQGLRAAMEKKGHNFAAIAWGKLKMFVQSICVVLLLTYELALVRWVWFDVLTWTFVWLMVISTVVSGFMYIYHASHLLNDDELNGANG